MKRQKREIYTISTGAEAVKARRKKGHGALVPVRGRWAMRWWVDGRLCQELTDYQVNVKADRARALARLEERTEIFRLKHERDKMAVLIAKREDIETRMRRLQAEAEPKAKAVTLGELEALWRESPRRRDCGPVMLERYAQQLRAFVAWAGADVDLRAVGDEMAEKYAAELAERVSGNTYNKHMTTLAAVWRAIGKARGVGNPWADLPRRRLETHVRRALTAEEVERVIASADGEYKALMVIGARTGLRLGDACRLRWRDFGADGVLRVATRKTGAPVALPGGKLKKELEGIVGADGDAQDLVTPRIAERYGRDPGGVCATIRRIFRRAGIEPQVREEGWGRARPDASFHSLRHTFVTRAIEAGVPAAIVRALVGHASAAMTDRYSHVSAEAMAAAIEKAGL